MQLTPAVHKEMLLPAETVTRRLGAVLQTGTCGEKKRKKQNVWCMRSFFVVVSTNICDSD
jgi:hypothetical protein